MVSSVKETEERKIWMTGKKSYVTTLPARWAQGIYEKKVLVSEFKKGLLLMPPKAEEPLKGVLDFNQNDPEMLRYEIITAYLNNFTEIYVDLVRPHGDCIRVLGSLPNKLLGLNVSFLSKNEFLITMSTALKPIPEILKNMLQQCKAIHQTNQEAMTTFKLPEDEIERVKAIENDMDRQSYLAKRLFSDVLAYPNHASRAGISDLTEIPHWGSLNSNLERIGDLQYEICLELQNLLKKFGKELSNKIYSNRAKYGFKNYHEAAQVMVERAYSNKKENQAMIIRTKREYEETGIKSRGSFITSEQANAIQELVNATKELACLDVRIWGLSGASTNVAESWLNMAGPTLKHAPL